MNLSSEDLQTIQLRKTQALLAQCEFQRLLATLYLKYGLPMNASIDENTGAITVPAPSPAEEPKS